jgi:acetyl esterase/lipase
VSLSLFLQSDIRNFLRVVNIARGSIKSAAGTAPESASPLVKNVAALGWGWYYSNMVILNLFGVRVDGASAVGADDSHGVATDIEQVRAYMNLAEDPVFAGMSSLAYADVALDFVFEIVPASVTDTVVADASSSTPCHIALKVPSSPVRVRLMSCAPRPIDRAILSCGGNGGRVEESTIASQRRRQNRDPVTDSVVVRSSCVDATPEHRPQVPSNTPDAVTVPAASTCGTDGSSMPQPPHLSPRPSEAMPVSERGKDGAFAAFGGMVKQLHDHAAAATSAASAAAGTTMRSRERRSRGTLGNSAATDCPTRDEGVSSASGGGSATIMPPVEGKSNHHTSPHRTGAPDSSLLTNRIKSEFVKLQSNVSLLLGQDRGKLAPCLIIHYHGGGFVSQSSAGHSVYLREWAAGIDDAVIFCVDYKLAPEFPYPTALDECAYVYQWALENGQLLGTTAERVVLCGDSAGGNLAVAVALKAEAGGLRRPDGLCLAYPALYVNVAWSPSRLLSFFDPLLPLSIIDICLRAYVPDGERPHENPLISPMVTPPESMRTLPPIAIVCGSMDPLLDDSVQFAHNLAKSGRTCDSLRVFESLPHGFMNMHQMSTDARRAVGYLGERIAGFLRTSFRNSAQTGEHSSVGEDSAGRTVSTAVLTCKAGSTHRDTVDR